MTNFLFFTQMYAVTEEVATGRNAFTMHLNEMRTFRENRERRCSMRVLEPWGLLQKSNCCMLHVLCPPAVVTCHRRSMAWDFRPQKTCLSQQRVSGLNKSPDPC